MCIWSNDLQQRCQDHAMRKNDSLFSRNDAGKLHISMQRNVTGPLYFTIHKNELKMDYRVKCKIIKYKTTTHSSIFSQKIPRTGETGSLQSMGLQRVKHV